MARLSMYMSNSPRMNKMISKNDKMKKVRMDYSCHGRYKGIHIDFSWFSLLSS